MSDPVRSIHRHVEREHREVIDGIVTCANAVERAVEGDRIADGTALRTALCAELERSGVLQRLPAVLDESVAAAGFALPASPVPAPPYVVVTSRGPVLRATIDPGRVVIRFDVFDVVFDSGGSPSYRLRDACRVAVTTKH